MTAIGRAAGEAARVQGVARSLSEIFAGGTFRSERADAPAASWEALPECVAARALRDRGASDADVRLLLTFTAAMDRARDAERLWRNAAALHASEPWSFDPAAVTARPLRDLVDGLRSHGVSQRHGPDAAAWRLIAESLADPACPAAVQRGVFEGDGDAADLRAALDSRTPAGTDLFPFLRGPKVGLQLSHQSKLSRRSRVRVPPLPFLELLQARRAQGRAVSRRRESRAVSYLRVGGFQLGSTGNVMPPTTTPSMSTVTSIRGGRRCSLSTFEEKGAPGVATSWTFTR